jgi:5S rRNA maturation endonuclease (ribonuclease M5)
MRPHAKQELDALAVIAVASGGNGDDATSTTTVSVPQQPHKVELIVLTDPDERGRELRAFLDAAFAAAGARARHAFVPEAAATKTAAAAAGGNHDVGNRGIEHAPPKAVKAALDVARPSHPTGRKAFTPEWARERGLAGAFEGAPHDGGDAARRRRDLCRALGLGQCSSAQMLSALNRYFDEDVVESAIEKL